MRRKDSRRRSLVFKLRKGTQDLAEVVVDTVDRALLQIHLYYQVLLRVH